MEANQDLVQPLLYPLIFCVALGKPFDLSESLFPYLENGGHDAILLR